MQSQQQPLAAPGVVVSRGTVAHTPGRWVYMPPDMVRHENYRHKESIGLGVAQIMLGILCIVFNCVSLGISVSFAYGSVGHGIWCGLLFIFTGTFGVSAGLSKTKCKIVTYMVLCIIAASFTAALQICGIIGSSSELSNPDCNSNGYNRYSDRLPCSSFNTAVAMEVCMAISGFIGAILFIWGATLCCKSSACGCCSGCCGCCGCCACCGCGDCCVLSPQPAYVPFAIAVNDDQMIQEIACSLPTVPYQTGTTTDPPPYQTTFAQPYFIQAPVASGMAVGASTTSVMATKEDQPKN